MNIIAADDEEFALNALCRVVKETIPNAILHRFTEPEDILTDIQEKEFYPDVAFLDIEMSDMNGLDLGQRIKNLCPKVNIIFVTGFSQYALDAYKLRASGYLTKPVTKEDILTEIKNLRQPLETSLQEKEISVHCFGNFEVKHHGQTVHFKRMKSLEMLAYLVSKQGNLVTMKELAAILWEDGIYDRSRQKQLAVIRHELIKTLEDNEMQDILIVSPSALKISPEKFDCDYYQMLAGDSAAIHSFKSNFMEQFSWAETVNAQISQQFSLY